MGLSGNMHCMIEQRYDIPFVANLARREKQIQQNYRPIIAVHKWFARRPGTLFRALMLAEFSDLPLVEAFYQEGNLAEKTIADPFMGGGTPLLEANRMGAHVKGCDINPMAWWIVRQELETLDLAEYRQAAEALRRSLLHDLGNLYRTSCTECGSDVPVKYFLWVKTLPCGHCGERLDLFPGYLVAEDVRHPRNVFVCPDCGQLTETADRKIPGTCMHCGVPLALTGPAKRSNCHCRHCGGSTKYPNGTEKPLSHRLFALEYLCPQCKPSHEGRFFKSPDAQDVARFAQAEERLAKLSPEYIPDESIPAGDETSRLHRWGYHHYAELFNARQLLSLEASCRLIADQRNDRVRNALATNLSDLLRYQNMLCRYDTMALKSLDIFSVHGFPVGLVQCESNILGIANGSQLPAGSGGWLNITEKYAKAKAYCDSPFEIRHESTAKNSRKTFVVIPGEWIGDARTNGPKRVLDISCADASSSEWQPESLDAVFTDPPYFGNVQYAELMDFCYIWLRRLVGEGNPVFAAHSTRHAQELTGNGNMQRGIEHFTEGLSRTFIRTAHALKPGSPFVFTYHHNDLAAYFPIAIAMLDAGLTCTAVLPCPAEMGASIHIKGTGSSTVDSVFVCRRVQLDRQVLNSGESLADALEVDMRALRVSGLAATTGDRRCVAFGHIIRQAVNSMVALWQPDLPVSEKIAALSQWVSDFGGQEAIARLTHVPSISAGRYASAPISAPQPVAAQGIPHAALSL